MNTYELHKKLNEINLLSAFPQIKGYEIAVKKNKETGLDEKVVQFNISKKMHKDLILDDYLLPKSLSSFGIDIKTSVKEEPQHLENHTSEDYDFNLESINHFESNTHIAGTSADELYFHELALVDDAKEVLSLSGTIVNQITGDQATPYVTFFHDDNPNVEPVKSHRQANRPLSGGVSGIYYPDASDATLGMFVRDKQDRRIVAMSNAHVYTATLLVGEEAKSFGKRGRTIKLTNPNLFGLSARSPGDFGTTSPFGNSNPAVDHIGIPKRSAFNTITLKQQARVDAAIVQLSTYNVGSNIIELSSNSILNFKQKGPFQFATKEELFSTLDPDSENYQAPIFRAGRTLGPLGFPGSAIDDKTIEKRESQIFNPSSLNKVLTTIEEVNIITEGLSTIDFDMESYFNSPNQGHTFYQSADRQKLYITGNRYFYNYNNPTINLFNSLTGIDSDVELAVEDSNKIDFYGIGRANFTSFYVNDINELYIGGQKPCISNLFFYGGYGLHSDSSSDPYYGSNATNIDLLQFNFNDTEISTPGIKKIYHDLRRQYVLTNDNKLFVRGANGAYDDDINLNRYYLVGKGENKDVFFNLTKYDENILDFATMDLSMYSNNVLVVSGDNKLYAAFSHYYRAIKDIADNTSGVSQEGYPKTDVFLEERRSSIGASFYADFFNNKSVDNVSLNYDKEFFEETIATGSTKTYTFNTTLCASYDISKNEIPVIIDGSEVDIKQIVTKKGWGALVKPLLPNGVNMFMCPVYLIDTQNRLIGYAGKKVMTNNSFGQAGDTAFHVKHDNDFIYWSEKSKVLFNPTNQCRVPGFLSGGEGARKENLDFLVGSSGGFNRFSPKVNFAGVQGFAAKTSYALSALYDKFDGETTNNNLLSVFKYSDFPPITAAGGNYFNYIGPGNSVDYRYINDLTFANSTGVSGFGFNYNNQLPSSDSLSETRFNDDIIVTAVGSNVNVGGGSGTIQYTDLFKIRSKNEVFPVSKGGDSGTAIFGLLSSTVPTASAWKVLGLLFAGPKNLQNDSEGICCDIDNIQRELNVVSWEGEIEE